MNTPQTCRVAVLVLCASITASSWAQTTVPVEFPADVQVVAGDALRERLAGKVFRVRLANGDGLRLQYNGAGYVFLNTDRGFNDDGTWRVDGDKVCYTLKRIDAGCNLFRARGESLYYQRTSGEVVEMKAQ